MKVVALIVVIVVIRIEKLFFVSRSMLCLLFCTVLTYFNINTPPVIVSLKGSTFSMDPTLNSSFPLDTTPSKNINDKTPSSDIFLLKMRDRSMCFLMVSSYVLAVGLGETSTNGV
ncbi:hypothetical protein EB796_004393 [Bugula neritina]|uniref:Uncharacterized protein n=1 Tax=Bugula neritina TaxID=10212 RepID=A0A7J7KGH7_BUGNE|nr:hypothetical protein EB796_004393 [Bugula neritina]